MKTLKLFILLFALAHVTLAKASADKITNAIKTINGDTIYIQSTIWDEQDQLKYYDLQSKAHKIKKGEIKWMKLGDDYWIAVPLDAKHKKDDYNVMRITAMSKSYIMLNAQTYEEVSNLYITDYDFNLKEKAIYIRTIGGGLNGMNKRAMEKINPYFESNKEIMDPMKNNMQNKKSLVDGIHLVRTNDAPEISYFINNYKDYRDQK